MKKALDYIENPDKTENKMLVSSFGCSYETADIEFEMLLCRWFRAAVLPLDGALYAEIIQSRDNVKRCAVCGAAFTPKSNRAKYCPDCAVRMRRKQEAERQRKRYLQATQLRR